MSDNSELRDDQFELYDLNIIVEKIDGNCTCEMTIGDSFQLKGGKLSMPEGKNFCLYALQSTLPLLPAKQRKNNPADWMETDARVICPDPECKLVMRIDREAPRVLNHDDVSPINWEGVQSEKS
ncbi:TIGR04076 family protein [Roseivirga sp. E12]|uniref:TIGR04076 family protein n=1 Tax=Roseivirga sp. E12 TaxID=2819237 RepID=UPI001ABC6ECC|nr:TIGR04076 family protein [Roseivirga sp. E12]MBO3697932.1 TIGR04076 family protein [Roseivirga sp. E12]